MMNEDMQYGHLLELMGEEVARKVRESIPWADVYPHTEHRSPVHSLRVNGTYKGRPFSVGATIGGNSLSTYGTYGPDQSEEELVPRSISGAIPVARSISGVTQVPLSSTAEDACVGILDGVEMVIEKLSVQLGVPEEETPDIETAVKDMTLLPLGQLLYGR